MVNFRDSYFSVQWDLSRKHLSGSFWGKQYDTGRGFTVTVINGGQVVTPSTEVLRLKWEKPDNTSGYVQATIINGKFVVENIDQMFTVHGSIRADFELSVGGEMVASITFYVNVEKAVAVDAIESSSEFTALQTAIGTVDGLDAEMALLQTDVDSLETQFNSVIANVTVDSEVILARGTEPTLGARLDASDAQWEVITKDLKNIVINGNFATTNRWTASGCTITTSNNVLKSTGNGTTFDVYTLQITDTPCKVGHKYFVGASARVTNDDAIYLKVQLDGGNAGTNKFIFLKNSPLINEWYKISVIDTLPNDAAGNFKILFGHTYTSNALSNNQSMEIKNVIALDLTEIFGAGKEPSAREIETILSKIEDEIYTTNKKIISSDDLEVIFVGSKTDNNNYFGDASIVKFPNGKILGIDFGLESTAAQVLKTTYDDNNVKKLDYILISHWHDDHAGGLKYLLDNSFIDIAGATVFLPKQESVDYAIANNFLDTVTGGGRYIAPLMQYFANNNCKIIYPSAEFEAYFIGGSELVFFNVDHSVYHGVSTNYNDYSLCNYIFHGNTNVCFTGDIGPVAEAQLAGNLYKANIYKVEHHGWNNSIVPPEYFNNVDPDICISIDGQVHDTYIMQSTSQFQTWCEANNRPNYRTRNNGSITVKVGKDGYRIMTPVSKFIRNNKNWKFTLNTEYQE